jgi:hypothetical protein
VNLEPFRALVRDWRAKAERRCRPQCGLVSATRCALSATRLDTDDAIYLDVVGALHGPKARARAASTCVGNARQRGLTAGSPATAVSSVPACANASDADGSGPIGTSIDLPSPTGESEPSRCLGDGRGNLRRDNSSSRGCRSCIGTSGLGA